MTEVPPAELLRRLRPIPTYRDHPATTPHDLEGVDPHGAATAVRIVGSAESHLLLFLSSTCLGCQDLWTGMDELRRLLPRGLRVMVVTQGPDTESASVVAALQPRDTLVVMSSQAYADYLVAGPPFLVVVAGDRVVTEGVAWGIVETARTVSAAWRG